MRGVLIVETQDEYDRWIATQKPQYWAAFPDKAPGATPAAAPVVTDSTIAITAGAVEDKSRAVAQNIKP
jgi:cytochrome c oxidase subunit II